MSKTVPLLIFKLKNGDGGMVIGSIDDGDTKESLIDFLIEKYGDRLDVEKTKEVNR